MAGLFGGGSSSPVVVQQAAPTPLPPPVDIPEEPKPAAPMPDTQSVAVREAQRRARADILRRGGRSSTILTTPESRGSDTYDSRTLGAG